MGGTLPPSQDGDGTQQAGPRTRRLEMIKPIDPGWLRINDALHQQERQGRRRKRRGKDEDGDEPEVDERQVPTDEETKLDLVA